MASEEEKASSVGEVALVGLVIVAIAVGSIWRPAVGWVVFGLGLYLDYLMCKGTRR